MESSVNPIGLPNRIVLVSKSHLPAVVHEMKYLIQIWVDEFTEQTFENILCVVLGEKILEMYLLPISNLLPINK